MQKNNKVIIISLIAIITIVIILTGTYAWYVWSSSEEDATKIVTNVGAATVYFDAGSDLNGSLKPVDVKEKGLLKEVNIRSDITSGLTFNLYLDISSIAEELKHESFKFELYENDSLVKEGNFSEAYLTDHTETCELNSTTHIILLTEKIIKSKTTNYKLYLWIDGVNYQNPLNMQNKNFSFKLHADGQNAVITEGIIPDIGEIEGNITTISNKLITDYYYAEKTTVTNNGVAYYYDKENGLVSDIDGNVRYYGANPNNYVYFNCETYPETNCEIWRIIGVFGGKTKLIRNNSIGTIAWDHDKNEDSNLTTFSNNWETASLQLFLNGLYYDRGTKNSHDYYSGSDGSAKTTLNLSTIGIKSSTRDMIADSLWYLGGYMTSDDLYPDTIYDFERTNEVGKTVHYGNAYTLTAKIGLMYASDYGYSADLSKCGSNFFNYQDRTASAEACRSTSWLNNGISEWIINHKATSSATVWTKSIIGTLPYGGFVYDTTRSVRPVLYLTPDIMVKSGEGTYNNPYRIGLDTTE